MGKPELIALGFLIVAATALLLSRIFFSRKPDPEEVERRRREQIHLLGKLGDGEIIDFEPLSAVITYSYSVAGVIYTTAQDASGLRQLLPADPMTVIGPTGIKFDPHNPANSIILCEEWSGLRQGIRTLPHR
ncbi:MAG: hypothetical protein M3N93_06580 [Acidobacteriota bacterium]|nr:hypothetical protein [Acidobacteriota bacterium]